MRDCEHCKHYKVKGCESWECKFEPRMTREKAVKILNEVTFLATDEQSREIDTALKMAIEALEELPSAERTGKWISYIDFDGYVECPFCESATNCDSTEDAETLHYCFNCGARLEGVKE